MAGEIPLFIRDAQGLLHQIATDEAAHLRDKDTPVTHVNLVVEILIPEEDLAARAAEEKTSEAARLKAEATRKQARDNALAKLHQLGLTEQDMAALLL